MDFPEFAQSVATRSHLSREEAADLSRATMELLGQMISSGEVRDLAPELPDGLREYLLQQGAEHRERVDFAEAVRRIHRRTGLSEPESDRGIRAALATLRETVSAREFDNAMSQIGHEYLRMIS